MPSKEETKELMMDVSPRGQPIPPDVMAAAENSIAGDSKRSEFYAVDQDRDEQGRFADEGKSGDAALAHKELTSKRGGWFHVAQNFYGKEYPEGVVSVEMRPDRALEKPYTEDRTMHVAFIGVDKKNRGKGLASKALKELTDMADKHGIPMTLDVQSQGGLSAKQLYAWYGRHGFKRQPYLMQPEKLSESMVRMPKK